MRVNFFVCFALFYLLFVISSITNAQTIDVSAHQLPKYSDYLSSETIKGLRKQDALTKKAQEVCNPYSQKTAKSIRECEKKYYSIIMPEAFAKYDVAVQAGRVEDVDFHIITPQKGIAKDKQHQVLINLHGGGFKYGGGFGGQLESMPLAHYGGYKVIAIDYKKAPDYRFPAANNDVETVYKHLLKTYSAKNIGIFGCSAGSRVAGQSLVHIAEKRLPMLGAVAFLCSAPTALKGDSNIWAAAMQQRTPLAINMVEYWDGLDETNSKAFPGDFSHQVAKFPPALLITSSRDYSLSPMIAMHRTFTQLEKPAELHIFEGLSHGQFLSMYIPEAEEAAKLMVDFFDRHLGDKGK